MGVSLKQSLILRRVNTRGNVLILTAVCIFVLVGFMSLAVDYGRVSVAKAELQTAVDAATRHAARTMRSLNGDQSAASASAAAVFAESKVDGAAPSFQPNSDMTLGIWNSNTQTFTPATVAQGANAVRIQANVVLGNQQRPLTLLSALRGPVTLNADCIATVSGVTSDTYVSGRGNPWLAGMPSGSRSDNLRPDAPSVHDHAGPNPNDISSPGMINLANAQIVGGQTIFFDNVVGGANNTGGSHRFTADGNLGWIVSLGTASDANSANWSRSVNGISNVKAPINSMIAVFLNDNPPNTTPAPANLDFSTPESRDYTALSPQLKQVFFVGDGRRSNGEVHQIVVPDGATRLFIGNMDAWQWHDNVGGYTTTINSTRNVTTVR